jgi:Uncharacterised nucleotidyltransferase
MVSPSPSGELDALRALFCGDPRSSSAVEETIARWNARSMLYSSLKRRGLEDPGSDVLRRMQRAHATTTAQNLELTHEAARILAALEAAGIDAVPLKGIALFLRGVYRDFGARPTLDIDVLTRPRDRARVTEVLRGLGYEQARGGVWPKHLPGFHRGELVVEVHEWAYWSLRDGAPVGVDAMIDRDGGARLDQAVVHLVHHLFEGSVREPWLVVKTLWDLNEVRLHALHAEERPQLLEEIAETADHAGLGGHLDALWGALAMILDLPTPPGPARRPASAREVVRPWRAAAPDARAVIAACRPVSPDDLRALVLRYYYKGIVEYPAWMKARALRTAFLPSRAQMEAIYGLAPGSPWAWPAYAVRPAHLLWRAAAGGARIARARIHRGS